MQVRKATVLASTVGFTLACWLATAQQPRKIDDAALKNAGKTGEDWISYGLTPGETRYSPLNQLNTTNISKLGLSWSAELGKGGGNQEGTPLEYNGVLYGITNWSVVWAIDARTGKEKWRWDPEVNQAAVRPKICCGVVSRGIAMYNGKIIAPAIDGRLIGLDMETGKPVWETRVEYSQHNYTLTMAPRVAHGKVIIGVAGAEYPVRGFFAAFDAETGRPVWKFYTVPGDPAKNYDAPPNQAAAMKIAAPTWEGEWWKLGGGGATVWDGMAYDPDTNLFYVGTGNAGPWPEDARGQSKGKDNLFAASIVAVNVDTGEYKWHFQMVPGDEWDFDSVQQLVLADVTIRGQRRKVIMQANKNGFFYAIDRVTGQFISGQPFAQVTWAKGLNEATGRPIVNKESYYDTNNSILIEPGPGGAHNWSPMSFNPNTGLMYVPTTTTSNFTYLVDKDFKFQEGKQNMGILFGRGPGGRGGPAAGTGTGATPETTAAAAAAAGRGPAASGAPPANQPNKITPPDPIGPKPVAGERGALIAWDIVNQKEMWRASGGGGIGGGTVTTAGNLVIQVVNDGRLVAYSADKGEKLLDVQTGLRGGMGPPITYMLDGKQYVALAGGVGTVVNNFAPPPPAPGAPAPAAAGGAPAAGAAAPPAGAGPGPGGPAAGPPVTPKLLVFELNGKGTLPVVEPQK